MSKNAVQSCNEASNYFLLVQGLYKFFSPTSRWEILQNTFDKGSKPTTLKSFSATRWSAQDDATKSLNSRWPDVLSTLSTIEKDLTQKPTTRAEARGLIENLNKLETVIMTKVWGFILKRLNACNKKLQKVDIDLSTVIGTYDSLIELFKLKRDSFEEFEEKGKQLSTVQTYESETKRRKKRKRHFDESPGQEVEVSARETFRDNVYLVIMDTLDVELTERREAYVHINEKFKALIELEKLSSTDLEQAARHLYYQFTEDLQDEETFISELQHLKSHLSSLDAASKPKTLISLCMWIREQDFLCIYPNVDIALRMFICVAASNCSGERSFSCLKRILTYLRSTM